MEIEMLLDNNERFKVLILQYLENQKNNYVHISKLYQITGITKFKMNHVFSSLDNDLLIFEENPTILIDESGVIETKNLNLEIVKKLRLYYLEQADTFKLLKEMIEDHISIEAYAERNHFSRSQIYIKRKIVKEFLVKMDIKLKKNNLIGNEIHIRNQLFSLYYESYNGIKFPFQKLIHHEVIKICNHYEYWFNLKMTNNDRIKFQILAGIALCRLKNGFFLKKNFFEENEIFNEFFNAHFPIISNFTRCNRQEGKSEMQYLLLYLFFNVEGKYSEKISKALILDDYADVDIFSEETSKEIYSALHFSDSLNNEEKRMIFNKYSSMIEKSNRNRFFFDFNITSFQSKRSLRFFSETYPEITEIIMGKISDNLGRHNLLKSVPPIQLFYDYIFNLFASCQMEFLERPIYVTVDFTFGKQYNEYICKQIEGFQHFNIRIEERISSKTNIYISDCIAKGLNTKQIIWKSPPTSDDWEDFGNSVVQAKNLR